MNTHVHMLAWLYTADTMGVLVSCCLRLFGYDNLGGAAVTQTSRRKQELSAILSEQQALSRYVTWPKN